MWKIFNAKLSDTLYMVNQRGKLSLSALVRGRDGGGAWSGIQREELWQSGCLAALGVAMLVPYLAARPPEPTPHSADCGSSWVAAHIISMTYIALLSAAATLAAFKARTLPENYNEAGSIATTMLLLLLVWVSSLPAYFRVTPQQRILVVSLAALFSSLSPPPSSSNLLIPRWTRRGWGSSSSSSSPSSTSSSRSRRRTPSSTSPA